MSVFAMMSHSIRKYRQRVKIKFLRKAKKMNYKIKWWTIHLKVLKKISHMKTKNLATTIATFSEIRLETKQLLSKDSDHQAHLSRISNSSQLLVINFKMKFKMKKNSRDNYFLAWSNQILCIINKTTKYLKSQFSGNHLNLIYLRNLESKNWRRNQWNKQNNFKR